MSQNTNLSDVASIINGIVEGNVQFSQNHAQNYFDKFCNTQHPVITLVTCSDSRVQSNIFGDDATDKIFTIRNIGNSILPVLGSVDYGVLHLNTPLLLILGHSHCGALKEALGDYGRETFDIIKELDHLSLPLRNLNQKAEDFEKVWHDSVESNLDYQVNLAVKRYKDVIDSGKLTIIGAIEDFINAYGNGFGRVLFTNVNGDNNPETIKNHPALNKIKDDKIFKHK